MREKHADEAVEQFVGDMVNEYNQGIYTRLETFAAVFRQLRHGNVDRAIGALPDELRSGFIAWAKESYENTIDPSEFVSIGGEWCPETPDEAFAAIRHWFAQHRSSAT